MTQEEAHTSSRAGENSTDAQEAVETYLSSLADLTVNSKPHINSLTMLAEDYLNYAEAIVQAVNTHLQQVSSNVKLPVLYLIDSIVKNVGRNYIPLFSEMIVSAFCSVFGQVDEKTRQQMYKLRQTWNGIYSNKVLYAMDSEVHKLDPNWPITAENPSGSHKIHINPRFLQSQAANVKPPISVVSAAIKESAVPKSLVSKSGQPAEKSSKQIRQALLRERRDLLQLEQKKVDLELSQLKENLNKKHRHVSELSEKASLQPEAPTEKPKKSPPSSPKLQSKPSLPTGGNKGIEATPSVSEPVLPVSLKKKEGTAMEVKLGKQEALALVKPVAVTRIAPASSALVNLVANQLSQRDPRLVSKPTSDTLPISVSEKKSRSSERDTRVKDDKLTKKSTRQSRNSSADRSSRQSSRREPKDKRSSGSRKSGRKSDERSSSRSRKNSSHSHSRSHSPKKRSPKRERKRDRSDSPESARIPRVVSDCADTLDSDSDREGEVRKRRSHSRGSSRGKSLPRTQQQPSPNSSEWPVNYIKGSHKGRNYMRRNRQESPDVACSPAEPPTLPGSAPAPAISDTVADVDLRLSGSAETIPVAVVPIHPASKTVPEQRCQDVDLRCLPTSPGKKRQTAEAEDGPPPSKKNKAAYIEMLFGNQDVDLRQINPLPNGLRQDAPSPPPPPVISREGKDDSVSPRLNSEDMDRGWSKFKQSVSPSTLERPPPFRSPRYGGFPNHRPDERGDRHRGGDTDMRPHMNGSEGHSKLNLQAILAGATKQLENGTMTDDDFNKVKLQVFRMHESEKLREAQRNGMMGYGESWDRRPMRERDYRHGFSPPKESYGDIDERFRSVKSDHPQPFRGKKPLLPLPSVPPSMPMQDDRSWDGDGSYMGPRMPRPLRSSGPMMPNSRMPMRPMRRPRMEPNFSVPPADPRTLDFIAQDPMKTITIDSVEREIRFYGEDAVIFMSGDDPREIAFDPGEVKVIFDDTIGVNCAFHSSPREVVLNGKCHRVHLGAPTRELYIDDIGYECQFNRPPVKIIINSNESHMVQLQAEGTPKVHIGRQRKDLVAGRILMVIDAHHLVPVFLDAKPQRVDIYNVPHVLRFANSLCTVLLNGKPLNIEFGGSPIPIVVNRKTHYIGLTKLPPGVVPGSVEIIGMTGSAGSRGQMATPANQPSLLPTPRSAPSANDIETAHEPVLPVRGARGKKFKQKFVKGENQREQSNGDRQMPPELLNAIQPGLAPLLSGLYSQSQSSSSISYKPPASSKPAAADSQGTSDTSAAAPSASGPNGIPFLGVDMDDVYQKLIASGIVSSLSSSSKKKEDTENSKVKEVDFSKSETLQFKQPAIISTLYSGLQCGSCGTRFPAELAEKYGQHLDWHFRQNRRDKDSARKAQSRKWYYDHKDWIQFEEIEDVEDRAQSWFETQQGDTLRQEEPEEEEIQSVPANDFPEGARCDLCHDPFEQFYNEEKEEWHLKHCIKVDEHTYHPLCYKDYRASVDTNEGLDLSEQETEEAMDVGDETENQEVDTDKKTGDDEVTSDNKVDTEELVIKQESDASEAKEEKEEEEEKMDVDTDAKIETEEGTKKEPESMDVSDVPAEENVVKEEPQSPVAESEVEDEGREDTKPPEDESKADETMSENDVVYSQGPVADTTHTAMACSIDGNVELTDAPPSITSAPAKIKINITKPLAASVIKDNSTKDSDEKSDEDDKADQSSPSFDGRLSPSQPLPPGVEPVLLKPKLVGRKLTDIPPVAKGAEVSGLCSIM